MIREPTNANDGDPLDAWIDAACDADPLPPIVDEPEAPREPPLTAEEIAVARTRLARWQEPPEFIRVTEALCGRCSSEDWFNRPHLKFLQDAYVLAEFVGLQAVERVRLADASEQWPDGQVQVGGKTHHVEITSTHGGRKLGHEYRGPINMEMDPVDNWIQWANTLPKYLEDAISAKARKNYGSACWLVVYLNINEYDIRQREIEGEIATIKCRHAASFEAIHVLWKQKLY